MNALFTIGIMLKAIDRASQVFKQMSNNAITEAMKISQKFKELGERMESLGMKAMANGMLMVAPIQKTVSTFADLEEAQARLKTTIMDETGKVGEEFKKLQELAARLGTELPGSTKDMIEMFIALREQGVQTQDILGGVGEAAAKFAVLMKIPFKEAATYVAKFQEALGVADKDMIKFMDLLQRLKYAAGVEVQDLYYTFKYLGPSLKTLKLQGLEATREIAAVIGVLASSGIEGSTAGTNLAMALSKMADASHKLDSKKIKELVGPILSAHGIKLSFFDEKGEFKGIKAMVAELEKLKVLSSQERLLVLSKLFGEEAARPLSVLIDKGVEGYEEMLKRIEKQADMQKKINVIMSIHKQKWDTLAGTVQNAVAYFGGATAKALQLGKVFEFLNNVFDKLNDFMIKHEKLTGIIGAGIAVAGGALIVVGGGLILLGAGVKLLGSGIDAMQTGIKAMKTFASWTVTARKELLRLIGVQKLMEASQYHGGFGKALSFWLYNTKLRILEATSAMKDWIVAQLKAFRTHFLTLTGLKNLARAFGVALVNALRAAIMGIRALSVALLTNPISWVALAIGTAAFLIYKYWKPISGFFKGLWEGIKESLKGLEPAWDVFNRAGKLLEPVLNALKGVYNFVKNLFKPVDDAGKSAEALGLRFGKAIGKILSYISPLPSKLFEAGKKLMEYLASGIMSAINKPIEAVKALAQRIRNFFPFSPAKEGPLRDLHKIKLMETIAQSLSPSPILQALYKITSAIKSSLLSLPMPVLSPALAGLSMGGLAGRLLSASQGSPTTIINLHQTLNISGNVDSKSAKEIANTVSLATKEAIFKAIDEYFRRKARPEWK